MNFVMVVKDVNTTKFMQGMDVFEPFKFVGMLMDCASQGDQDAKALLHQLNNQASKTLIRMGEHEGFVDEKTFEVVGVIIPGGEAAFAPNHTVISLGDKWTMVDKLCEGYGAKLS